MMLDLDDCTFVGPALPEPFVQFELAAQLAKHGLLSGAQTRTLERGWSALRRQLRTVGPTAGPHRICNQIIAPLSQQLGFALPERAEPVATREGMEDGGWVMHAPDGAHLRAWSIGAEADLDAPHRISRAYRFSPTRSAQRVLMASGKRLGLLTNGQELRLLIGDPARPDSHVAITLDGSTGWRGRNLAPDSYRLLLALATPNGIATLPELLDAARLYQTWVTRDLRVQARSAVEGFLQAVLDNPANAAADLGQQAGALWDEGLILVYRLLFVLKLESAADAARAFSFASTSLWRNTLSPNRALGPMVRRYLDHGHDTGRMLEDGIRLLFRVFRDGLACSELSIAPLGGALFGMQTTPLLDRLAWGERAIALLLDRLLWTSPKGRPRERVHYGALDVEELGRVYEALLELEPGIASVPMARLRRAKLELVVPVERARPYRTARNDSTTRVAWIEDIQAGRFFLRAGIGRKASGSYYTPHEFVRFLVHETLGPIIEQRSPDADPHPGAILALKVLDLATGSGHFLVEACRYLGEALYAACRMCDELATAAETDACNATTDERARLLAQAAELRQRITDLPEPDGLLSAYLPSRANEGRDSGVSQSRALAICRRLVAVHCLYGVDTNRLAVELAKLSLWLESYAEGLPLTFLDHRLVHGNSVTGPFFTSLATFPVGGEPLDPLLASGVEEQLGITLRTALREVDALQATVGANAADLVLKTAAKARLDAALRPLHLLARAWSGAVMLGTRDANDEWLALARSVATDHAWPASPNDAQVAMLDAGAAALPWDLTFPEVFWRGNSRGGFDAVLSNPPWDIMQPNTAEFLAGFDLSIMDASTQRQVRKIEHRLLSDAAIARALHSYQQQFARQRQVVDRLYLHQRYGALGAVMGGKLDLYRVFAERMMRLLGPEGAIGTVVPSAFHANEGATGVRRLYLEQTRLERCLSFENRRKLFDIHASFKFALLVARRPGPTQSVRCGFYLTEFDQIAEPDRLMDYDMDFIRASGGPYETLLELRDCTDVALAARMFSIHSQFGTWMHDIGITLSREIHMSDDAGKFTLLDRILHPRRQTHGSADDLLEDGYLLLHEGKTIHQFTDHWDAAPKYAIRLDALSGKPQTLESAQYYRAACREVASSTNERTAIAAILPPGMICGHTISVERRPAGRPNAAALSLVGLMNSFSFDWLLRQKAAAHVSLYILAELPVPQLSPEAARFLAHGCLRLCCNHHGFSALWREQLGDAWHEPTPRRSWPVMADAAERWRLRATMDAVIAHAYRLDRAQYERILRSFSHKSCASAPTLCLAAFDELASVGPAAFLRKHDPYCDVRLGSPVARPVIRLATTAARHRTLALANPSI